MDRAAVHTGGQVRGPRLGSGAVLRAAPELGSGKAARPWREDTQLRGHSPVLRENALCFVFFFF